ncbi:BON domain-containing protein [Photobacterium sp. TY1-4]|uniref:BON domain-containing protein n=1 Tax=Photobacterium sp. TY1-4 TaxID=2899122 RepID=UPI0021BFE523|nr:BON domain-containing protein [Photobacterium sp. TY1-4]UXI01633.1 BON domain-containing protein [Photobacterium sp. TY1-4]
MRKFQALLLAALLLLQGCATLVPSDPRSAKRQWFDQHIEMEIGGLVNKPPYRQQARINAVAFDGKVLLVGQAVDEATKSQLAEQIRQLSNVSTVFNQIQVRPLPKLGEVSQDSWLTTKVKSQLIGSKKLQDVAIQVLTESQAVYLLGYVTREQAHIATEIARNVNGVKQVVKVFEYLESPPAADPS